jgi:hypothetical protein
MHFCDKNSISRYDYHGNYNGSRSEAISEEQSGTIWRSIYCHGHLTDITRSRRQNPNTKSRRKMLETDCIFENLAFINVFHSHYVRIDFG